MKKKNEQDFQVDPQKRDEVLKKMLQTPPVLNKPLKEKGSGKKD